MGRSAHFKGGRERREAMALVDAVTEDRILTLQLALPHVTDVLTLCIIAAASNSCKALVRDHVQGNISEFISQEMLRQVQHCSACRGERAQQDAAPHEETEPSMTSWSRHPAALEWLCRTAGQGVMRQHAVAEAVLQQLPAIPGACSQLCRTLAITGLQLTDELLAQAARRNVPRLRQLAGTLSKYGCFYNDCGVGATGLSDVYAAVLMDTVEHISCQHSSSINIHNYADLLHIACSYRSRRTLHWLVQAGRSCLDHWDEASDDDASDSSDEPETPSSSTSSEDEAEAQLSPWGTPRDLSERAGLAAVLQVLMMDQEGNSSMDLGMQQAQPSQQSEAAEPGKNLVPVVSDAAQLPAAQAQGSSGSRSPYRGAAAWGAAAAGAAAAGEGAVEPVDHDPVRDQGQLAQALSSANSTRAALAADCLQQLKLEAVGTDSASSHELESSEDGREQQPAQQTWPEAYVELLAACIRHHGVGKLEVLLPLQRSGSELGEAAVRGLLQLVASGQTSEREPSSSVEYMMELLTGLPGAKAISAADLFKLFISGVEQCQHPAALQYLLRLPQAEDFPAPDILQAVAKAAIAAEWRPEAASDAASGYEEVFEECGRLLAGSHLQWMSEVVSCLSTVLEHSSLFPCVVQGLQLDLDEVLAEDQVLPLLRVAVQRGEHHSASMLLEVDSVELMLSEEEEAPEVAQLLKDAVSHMQHHPDDGRGCDCHACRLVLSLMALPTSAIMEPADVQQVLMSAVKAKCFGIVRAMIDEGFAYLGWLGMDGAALATILVCACSACQDADSEDALYIAREVLDHSNFGSLPTDVLNEALSAVLCPDMSVEVLELLASVLHGPEARGIKADIVQRWVDHCIERPAKKALALALHASATVELPELAAKLPELVVKDLVIFALEVEGGPGTWRDTAKVAVEVALRAPSAAKLTASDLADLLHVCIDNHHDLAELQALMRLPAVEQLLPPQSIALLRTGWQHASPQEYWSVMAQLRNVVALHRTLPKTEVPSSAEDS